MLRMDRTHRTLQNPPFPLSLGLNLDRRTTFSDFLRRKYAHLNLSAARRHPNIHFHRGNIIDRPPHSSSAGKKCCRRRFKWGRKKSSSPLPLPTTTTTYAPPPTNTSVASAGTHSENLIDYTNVRCFFQP